jgi:hypothetical protein
MADFLGDIWGAVQPAVGAVGDVYKVAQPFIGPAANALTGYAAGESYKDAIRPYAEGGAGSFRTYTDVTNQPFATSPGYQFAFDEGTRAVDRSAASRGKLFSGATIKAQQRFGQGLANQEYQRYLDNLYRGGALGASASGAYGAASGNQWLNAGAQARPVANALGALLSSPSKPPIGEGITWEGPRYMTPEDYAMTPGINPSAYSFGPSMFPVDEYAAAAANDFGYWG